MLRPFPSIRICLLFGLLGTFSGERADPQAIDPGAWGSDHVGKPVPEFVTGDECLFCHRSDIGPKWTENLHRQTIHDFDAGSAAHTALANSPATKGLAQEVTMLLGHNQRVRFLKPSRDYGKLDLLSAQWQPARKNEPARLIDAEKVSWDTRKFAEECAGCHTTGVDSQQRTFAAISLDCFVCHGDVSLEHTKKKSTVYLGKKGDDPARVITSICAQCHLRDGKSRSTGLPYPNNFVAGDNLFRDFQFDFSPEHVKSLNPGDRHVVENVRAVALLGKEDVTCLSCHEIHKMSTKKHHRLAGDDSCVLCHTPTGSKKTRPGYEVHSKTCGY